MKEVFYTFVTPAIHEDYFTGRSKSKVSLTDNFWCTRFSGSHGGVYGDDSILGYSAA
jgi:hypothetical protein